MQVGSEHHERSNVRFSCWSLTKQFCAYLLDTLVQVISSNRGRVKVEWYFWFSKYRVTIKAAHNWSIVSINKFFDICFNSNNSVNNDAISFLIDMQPRLYDLINKSNFIHIPPIYCISTYS